MSIKQAIEALEQLVISVQNATPDEGCEQSIAHARGMGEAAIQSLRSIPDAKPVAWAIFTDAGNARMWTTFQPHVQKLADAEGLTVTPLYAEPAALAALRSMPAEPVPDGYKLIAVTKFDPLVMALDRAFSKGYLPDALEKPWADFDWEEVATPQTEAVRMSDAEILALWSGSDDRALRPVLGSKKIIAFARAILATKGGKL